MRREATQRDHAAIPIRAASLTRWDELVRALGGDPPAILDSFGLSPSVLSLPEERISFVTLVELLEYSAASLGCPDFGIRLSRLQGVDFLGPLAMIAQYSESLQDALSLTHYMSVHSPGGEVALDLHDPDHAFITYRVVIPGLQAKRQINELSLGVAQNLLELLIGKTYVAPQVRFMHGRPVEAQSVMARFGRHVHFDQGFNGLAVPAEMLGRPMPSASAFFRAVALDYASRMEGERREPFAARVERVIASILPEGGCSLAAVARKLGCQPRTLERRLGAEGLTYADILENLRKAAALEYLSETDAPLFDVAMRLGYADQSTFTRRFRAWYGISPGRWRTANARNGAGEEHAPRAAPMSGQGA